MNTSTSFSKSDLDHLFDWLSPDREEAGRKYLEIHEGLVRYFRIKGCRESQVLADETINRVTSKLKGLDTSRGLKPTAYFYGFAKNIFLEYLAALKKTPTQLDTDLIGSEGIFTKVSTGPDESRLSCLDECMAKLRKEESAMMLAYFEKDRSEKFESRRRLAQSLNITMGNLHIKVHRIKQVLKVCLENCMECA